MQPRRSTSYAVRHVLVTGALAVLTLSACGTTAAPDPGQPAGPIRPVATQPTAADGALECPTSLRDSEGTTVPAKPQGVDGAARLVPDRDPGSLVVCADPVMDVMATKPLAPPFSLARRSVATDSQRSRLVAAMTWAPRWNKQPRACTAMAGNETAYLVGADYGDAIVWVAAKADANACAISTNGDFTSGAPLGITVDEMFGARRSPTEPAGACTSWSWGRLGDDRSLAPVGDPKASDSRFALVLTYAVGPAVRVNVDPGCDPPVLGSNLESADTGDLVELVEQWSPPIPGPDPNGSVSSDGSVSPGAPLPPDAPTQVPGSTGGGAGGSTGIEPAAPTDVPRTR